MAPLSEEKLELRATISRDTGDLMREAMALLGVNSSEVDVVLQRALRDLVARLRKRKYGLTDQPRRTPRAPRAGSRRVPNAVKRQVYLRDEGRCTFVSETGRRCEAREHLEYDHEREFARGGESTVANIRLRCRAHNQFTAERTFGTGFMARKRQESGMNAGGTRGARTDGGRPEEAAPSPASPPTTDRDLLLALRSLGYRADQAKEAVAFAALPNATFEERIRRALSYFRPRGRTFDANGVEVVRGPAAQAG